MDNNVANIKNVVPNSIADELDIKKGDNLLKINGANISDILEYKFLTTDEFLELEIEKPDGEIWILELEKEFDEDIGIVFDGIIDKPKSCHNKCIFCFIDQMPPNMRDTLYFKDDDTRLSFLQGNFVSLTNLSVADINRILRYRISPINVSVHTTNPELRVKMLNNRKASRIMENLRKFKRNGIVVKAQVVLCPDINDGIELDRTIKDLADLYPELSCLAIVPVGLTKYRDNLYPLQEFDEMRANTVIQQVSKIQNKLLEVLGTRFVFLSDEFYIIAKKDFPNYDDYEGFSQLENGVGLVTLFNKEIEKSLDNVLDYKDNKGIKRIVITGKYAEKYINKAVEKIKNKLDIDIYVLGVDNDFFGNSVKVCGLLTAKDIIRKFRSTYTKIDKDNCVVFIPDNMLRDSDVIFLDDVTVEEMEIELNAKIIVCNQDGSDLVQKIMEY